MRERKIFLLSLTSKKNPLYKEIYANENIGTIKQGVAMVDSLKEAVTDSGYFDLSKAIEIVDQHSQFIPVNWCDQNINHDRIKLIKIVNQVKDQLKSLLDIRLTPEQQQAIQNSLTLAFTNLYEQKQDRWFNCTSQSAYSTTYQYNLFFLIQNAFNEFFLYGLPVGMTIQIDRTYERVLLLELEDEVSCSVNLEALKIMQAV